MEAMSNKLLARQVKKHFGSSGNIPSEIKDFLTDINHTYNNFDDDIFLLQNSIEISSLELRNAYQKHKLDAEAQKETILKIKEAIEAIKPAADIHTDANGTNLSDTNRMFDSLLSLIEEHKKAEEEIRKLSLAVEQNPASIVITDTQGNIEYVNPTFCRLTGYKKEEVIGKNPRILKGVTILPNLYEELWQTILSGREWKGEFHNRKKNGELYWELASISSVKNNKGEIVNFLAIKEDITQRKKTEEALENERALFRTVIDLIPDAVYVKDTQGRKVLANPTDVLFSGKKNEEDLIGKTDSELYPTEQAKSSYNEDMYVLHTGKSILNIEGTLIDWNKDIHSLLVSKVPLYDVQGKITGLVGVTHDITERKKVQDELFVAHKSLSDLLNAAVHISIISTNTEGVITVFNKGAERMLGYKAEDLIGNKTPDIFHLESEITERGNELSEKFGRTIQGFEIFVANAKNQEYEERIWTYVCNDGRKLNVNLVVTAIRDFNHEIIGYLGIANDISRRVAAEKALMQSSKKWEAIISASPDGIGMVSLDGKLQFMSDKLAQMYGFAVEQKDEYIGQSIFDFIDVSNHQLLKDNMGKLLAGLNENKITEYLAIKIDNSRFYVDVNSTILPDENGKPATILFIERDITERKKAEEELKQISTRLAMATYAGGVGIWDFDILNDILIWDEQMYLLYGVEKSGFKSAYDTWLAGVHPEDAVRADSEMQNAINNNADFNTEFRVCWPDGSVHNIRAIATVLHNNNGVPLRMIGTNWDISEQKKTESNLLKARHEAEMANIAKSEFLANVSHEIRTPMNAIIGFSEILMGKITEPKYREHLKTILNSGHTLLTLINDILDLSKIEAGKLEVEFEAIHYKSVIQEIEQVFLPKVQSKEISFEIMNSPLMPEYIYMDEIRFHQILFNLVGNAIKFTHKGFVRLETKVAATNNDNTINLIIEIEDTGIGISKNQLETIFEAFTQQSGQSNRQYEGTGLGLAITKRLIEKMDGTIKVESQVGKGSLFSIYFNNIQRAEIKPLHEKNIEKNDHEIFFAPATILIVDDIDFNIQVLRHMLDFENLSFLVASSGEAALEILEIENPDLIFMDIRMPGISGISTTEIIKNNEKRKHIPIIAFTASVMQSQLEQITNIFDGFLQKPVSKKALIQLVKNHLNFSYSPVITIEKPIEVLSKNDQKCIDNIDGLLQIIDEKIYAEWLNISGNLVIFEIEEFCDHIDEILKLNRCDLLAKYSFTLRDNLQSFDVELIENTLKEFEEIYATLKKQQK